MNIQFLPKDKNKKRLTIILLAIFAAVFVLIASFAIPKVLLEVRKTQAANLTNKTLAVFESLGTKYDGRAHESCGPLFSNYGDPGTKCSSTGSLLLAVPKDNSSEATNNKLEALGWRRTVENLSTRTSYLHDKDTLTTEIVMRGDDFETRNLLDKLPQDKTLIKIDTNVVYSEEKPCTTATCLDAMLYGALGSIIGGLILMLSGIFILIRSDKGKLEIIGVTLIVASMFILSFGITTYFRNQSLFEFRQHTSL